MSLTSVFWKGIFSNMFGVVTLKKWKEVGKTLFLIVIHMIEQLQQSDGRTCSSLIAQTGC